MLKDMLNERLKIAPSGGKAEPFNLKEFRESIRSKLTTNPTFVRNDPNENTRGTSNGLRVSVQLNNAGTIQDPKATLSRPPSRQAAFLRDKPAEDTLSKNDSFVKSGLVSIPNFVSIGGRGKSLNTSVMTPLNTEPKLRQSQLGSVLQPESLKASMLGQSNGLRLWGTTQQNNDCGETRKWPTTSLGQTPTPKFEVMSGTNLGVSAAKHVAPSLRDIGQDKRSSSVLDNVALRGTTLPFGQGLFQIRPSSEPQDANLDKLASPTSITQKIQQSRERLFKSEAVPDVYPVRTDVSRDHTYSTKFDLTQTRRHKLEREYPLEVIRAMSRRFEDESIEDFQRLDEP